MQEKLFMQTWEAKIWNQYADFIIDYLMPGTSNSEKAFLMRLPCLLNALLPLQNEKLYICTLQTGSISQLNRVLTTINSPGIVP